MISTAGLNSLPVDRSGRGEAVNAESSPADALNQSPYLLLNISSSTLVMLRPKRWTTGSMRAYRGSDSQPKGGGVIKWLAGKAASPVATLCLHSQSEESKVTKNDLHGEEVA